jgi:hypothetical protein
VGQISPLARSFLVHYIALQRITKNEMGCKLPNALRIKRTDYYYESNVCELKGAELIKNGTADKVTNSDA